CDWRVDLAGDRSVADDAFAWLPLRGNTGVAPGASPGGGVGDDRRQPGQSRRRQPGPAAQGAASVRVVDGAGGTRRGDRTTLRAGLSTFDLSRYMGASLTMIDRHYGHLARDGREHAINLLDATERARVRPVDAGGRSVDAGDAGRRHA